MWDLGNRAVVALVSVLSGCVFLYNVWGPILVLTVSLCLAIYACYSLIVNDSLLSPHAFLFFDHCKHVSLEAYASFESLVDNVYRYAGQFWKTASRRFRERYFTQARMDRRRGSHYQLSSDSYPTPTSSPKFGLISQLSPIPRTVQKPDANSIRSENKSYLGSNHSSYDHSSFDASASVPLFHRDKEEYGNESLSLLHSNRSLSKGMSPPYSQNRSFRQDENSTYFPPEGSPWGTGISPRAQSRTTEVKAVQTVAGPLLGSNRYNIDPKTYSDVTSPGLATRLTKYAAEANSKLSHQTQYHVGQFPKVNLHATPVPLINAKCMRTRTPATVRVAPPDATRYSPPGKQKILSNSYYSDSNCSSPGVAQTLKEISLKRHASGEDVLSDLAKKQRTDGISNNESETQDETKQKRSRDDSSRSEEDISPQNKTVRPMKRTKTPSCYDILNSLSSSKNVVSGVKRKARDLSRSGTPDFEKHFKSLECVQNTSVQPLPQTESASAKPCHREIVETKTSDACNSPPSKIQEHTPLRGILKASSKSQEIHSQIKEPKPVYGRKDRSTEALVPTESAKLTNKLFMRAEPERNEKLRMLVEEQGNIKAKFTTDDVEEIKKEDIADMRQTSMKARLQSMFDAISGKATSRINPDVVIQAEEVNAVKPVACPATCATLNSSTTTTNVNTTPISTSSIVLGPGATESETKSPKHITFNLPSKEAVPTSNIPVVNVSETKTDNISGSKPDAKADGFRTAFATASTPSVASTTTSINVTGSSSSVQSFDFGKSSSAAITSTSSPGTFTFGAVPTSNKVSTAVTPMLAASTATNLFGNTINATPKSVSVSMGSGAKSEANQSKPMGTSQILSNVAFSSSSTLRSGSAATTPATLSGTIAMDRKGHGTGSTSVPITGASAMPFKSIASTASAVTTAANASAPLFAFGSQSSNVQTSKTEAFVFGSTGNVSQGTNVFGSSTNSQQPLAMANATGTASSSTQSNSASTGASIGTFSSSAKTCTVLTFTSASPAASSAASNSKPGFSFNATTSTTNALSGTSNASVFGSGNNNSTFTFGSSSAGNPAQFNPSSNSSIFGTASTSSIFGTTNSQPVFGTPSSLSTIGSTFAAPKTTTTPTFGPTTGTTSTAPSATSTAPVFSNIRSGPASGATSTQISMPVFGSSTGTSSSEVPKTSTNLFSNVNSTSATSAFGTTGNIFGKAKSPTTGFKSLMGVFGNHYATLFGSQTATTTATTTTTPMSAFASTNVSSSATAPAFDAANVPSNATGSTFAFGTRSNAGTGAQGSAASQPFANGTSVFKTDSAPTHAPAPAPAPASAPAPAPAPVFGASTSGAFASSVSNVFDGQNTTAPTFAPAGDAPAFGENKPSPFGSQVSAFGTPNASVSAFGTANASTANNNNRSNMFSFGANQKPPEQTASFSFGGNSNTNNNVTATASAAAATSTPFQFSAAATSKPATGFNFSAPSSTPAINFGTTSTPSFNAPTAGMFNIGSGSTAPRSRNVRTRKPR